MLADGKYITILTTHPSFLSTHIKYYYRTQEMNYLMPYYTQKDELEKQNKLQLILPTPNPTEATIKSSPEASLSRQILKSYSER